MKYLENIIQQLKKWQTNYVGCSDNEISELENMIGGKFPACYLEFLKTMGKSMDSAEYAKRGYLAGNSVFYEDLFENKEFGLLELLEEDERPDLIEKVTENIFVFYDSQGILSAFFKLDEGDDPKIYGYAQGFSGDEFPIVSESLSQFYERILNSDKTLFKEVYD